MSTVKKELEIINIIKEKASLKSIVEKWKSLSMKRKIVLITRIIIIMVCTVGLIHQTFQLIDQYREGRTVVSINYETRNYDNIPGITVCYPTAFSMKKMADKYPELKERFEVYKKILATDYIDEDTKDDDLFRIYNESFAGFIYSGKVYQKDGIKQGMKIEDIFDITIPFEQILNNTYNTHTITISTNGVLFREVNKSFEGRELNDSNPIQTIVFNRKGEWHKCFTFYSHLNDIWKEFQIEIINIYIDVYFDELWFPKKIMKTEGIKLSMHSPDELPQYEVDKYVDIERVGSFNNLIYNRWTTKLLGENYQTNCIHYDLEAKQKGSQRMRSDCVKHCLQKELNKCLDKTGCGQQSDNGLNDEFCDDCIFYTSDLWTEHDFDDQKSVKVCQNWLNKTNEKYMSIEDCYTTKSQAIKAQCHYFCNNKCMNRYYNYQLKSVLPQKLPINQTMVKIIHNLLPDQITEHMPEMTGIQFASNFGGLLGMWMGLSALAIFKYLFRFFFK